jgi:hypothetical protein
VEDSYEDFVYQDEHLNIDETLVWVCKPQKYVEAVTYTAYGNEPHTATQYVACAFIVTVPPFGDGERGKFRNEIVEKIAGMDVVKSRPVDEDKGEEKTKKEEDSE